MMEDFNAMNSSIEAGLTRTEGKADTAVSTANAAKQSADIAYTPDNKPYSVGSYTGDGTTYRNIDVGFRPSFVIVAGDQRAGTSSTCGTATMMASAWQSSQRIYMTDTGFRLDSSETSNPAPYVNKSGTVYSYIVFR